MAGTLAVAAVDPVLAMLLQAGWLASAVEWLQEPVWNARPPALRHLAAALIDLGQQEWTLAIDKLRRLTEREPPSAFQTTCRAWLGRAWHGLGQLDMAEEVVKSCLGLPGSDEAVLELARLQDARGHRQAAMRTLVRERRRLIERHPSGGDDVLKAGIRFPPTARPIASKPDCSAGWGRWARPSTPWRFSSSR
jgi:tetratricopeptide (TPR) repeat protein